MTQRDVAADERTAIVQRDRVIGAILVDAGRLSVEDAERVLRLQTAQKIRFGDAAIKLGVVTQADIDLALACQFDYPYLIRGTSNVSEEVTAAYEPFSVQVEGLRALRSQLMLRWFDADQAGKTLAIVSAEYKEGRSFIAANLAVVFSQLGERVLLIDADMRQPRQHALFGVDNHGGLSSVLAGREHAHFQKVEGLRDLSVLPAGSTPPNPIELLARPTFTDLLSDVRQQFDIILLDSPPAKSYADTQMIAARAGAALVVTRNNQTRLQEIHRMIQMMAQASATVIGTVLNAA